jgi:hypothetical protein
LASIHLYGAKAAGQTPDDILFTDAAGSEVTALEDWGDRPEGTMNIVSGRVKNASPDKYANNVNLQLNHSLFALSWSADGPWQATLDTSQLAPEALSAVIYKRCLIPPPLQTLGPQAARVIANVGSWSS